jgi:CheY-like chemotaxis protein
MKNTQTIHCFLIDDDPEEIDIFRLALGELDIDVKCTSFTSCQEALRTLIRQEVAPDCIFLDLYMGATSGKECLNIIVNTEIIAQIPTVILSGSRNEPEIAELKSLGAQEFIVKSLTISGLAEQLNQYFSTHFNLNEGLTI